MLANKLTPILEQLELTMLQNAGTKHNYPDKALQSAAVIMMDVLMSKMFDLQERENMPFDDRCKMATKCGEEIRKLIKTYADIDMHELVKK